MKVSIIGIGYVGLATGICLADKGHEVICVDRSKEVVDMLNNGKIPTYEPGLEELLIKCLDNNKIKATLDLNEGIINTDISIVCVGTPDRDGKQDLSQIENVSRQIGKVLKNKKTHHTIVIKSTVLPTTTDTFVKKLIEIESGKKLGEFSLAMNPEFLRQGSALKDFMDPGRIIIGYVDEESKDSLLELYKYFNCPKIIMKSRSAEMVKYACNSFLATMVSFSNEFAAICESIGDVDIIDVLRGLRSDYKFTCNGKEPVANSYLWAGCGYGGSCFPKDVQAIYSFSKERGVDARILKGTVDTNIKQPEHLYNLVKKNIDFKNKKVAILGLSFKPDTDDMRGSPSIPIINLLLKDGAKVICHDPISINNAKTNFLRDYKIEYASSKEEAIKDADILFVITPWKEYKDITPIEFSRLMENGILVDCRRIYNKEDFDILNIKYIGVGI